MLKQHRPVLYILMPLYVPSMNPGKAMAQAAHAANQCVYEIENNKWGNGSKVILHKWRTTITFGVTIVLGIEYDRIQSYIDAAQKENIVSRMVLDPSYPLKDGDVMHSVPFETCGFIFGYSDEIKTKLSSVSHPSSYDQYATINFNEEKLMP